MSYEEAREKAKSLGVNVTWDCELARTPEGYYPIQGGIDYAIAKSLAVAPYCDIIWMETKTANLPYAKRFAEAIHARYPEQMLAYNLSPSFNWDTTGMTDDEMRDFPAELGKLGYVFDFITYGGHQVDGMAAEDFATALKQDGMLSLARLQRKLRLVESPYKTPQSLVGGPRLDGALMASSGRTATTKAMGKGSTQVSAPGADRSSRSVVGGVASAVGPGEPNPRPDTCGAAAPYRRLGVAFAESDQPRWCQRSQHHIRNHSGSTRPADPLYPRPGDLRQHASQKATDDLATPVPDSPIQSYVGALREPDRG